MDDFRVLQTNRLLLRTFQIGDIEAVYDYAKDSEWQRYLPVTSPYTLKDAQNFIEIQLAADFQIMPHWAIVYQESVVGSVSVTLFEEYDYKIGELGYSLKRSEWGKGFITEAATAAIDYVFRSSPKLIRIEASADSHNKASLKVMEKLGMTYEGILRRRHFVRGQLGDEVYYSILKSEWSQRNSTCTQPGG